MTNEQQTVTTTTIVPPKACQRCGAKGPTSVWTADDGGFGYVHGMYSWWCERCILTAQLDHAKARAAAIPELEAKLAALRSPEGKP